MKRKWLSACLALMSLMSVVYGFQSSSSRILTLSVKDAGQSGRVTIASTVPLP